MKILKQVSQSKWPELIRRAESGENIEKKLQDILYQVRILGDEALFKFSRDFDQVDLPQFKVSHEERNAAKVSMKLASAIELAKSNISRFHKSQFSTESIVETMEGVKCWRKSIPIERVGLYIPGGSAPLFSTLLMLAIPAQLAGCKEIIICTPANRDGEIHPAILFVAKLIGISSIYKLGGAQAIAAMTYGTKSIPRVNKIFGPGNQYVTKAKELVQKDGMAIDLPAGPSELLIIADSSCKPAFVAADLLSQLEHGFDSQVMLLSNDQKVLEDVIVEVNSQIKSLPRRVIAKKALANSKFLLMNSLQDCLDFSNYYAPEHLILNTRQNEILSEGVLNAGSVFIGQYSCESAGDYASGTNHTLPTNGFAKNYSGVSVDSFLRKVTFQKITEQGIRNIGPAIETMAEAEELEGHKRAVTIRLKDLGYD